MYTSVVVSSSAAYIFIPPMIKHLSFPNQGTCISKRNFWNYFTGEFFQKLGQSTKCMMFQKIIVFEDDVKLHSHGKDGLRETT